MRMRTMAVLMALVLGSAGVSMQRPSTTEAHLSFNGYIYSGSSRQDPVNVLFASQGASNAAYVTTVWNHVLHHLNWSYTDGSSMNFSDHGVTDAMDHQRASRSVVFTRWHVRFEQGSDKDNTQYGVYTIAAAHHDGLVWCGHVGEMFNQARDTMANAFAGAHGVSFNGWWMGNTLGNSNCDGSSNQGNGWMHILWIAAPGGPH